VKDGDSLSKEEEKHSHRPKQCEQEKGGRGISTCLGFHALQNSEHESFQHGHRIKCPKPWDLKSISFSKRRSGTAAGQAWTSAASTEGRKSENLSECPSF